MAKERRLAKEDFKFGNAACFLNRQFLVLRF